jgi:hypothetical protein
MGTELRPRQARSAVGWELLEGLWVSRQEVGRDDGDPDPEITAWLTGAASVKLTMPDSVPMFQHLFFH